MGADRKANAQGPVRGSCGLLELLQRGVALETLGKSKSCLRAEAVVAQTASMGAEVGAEACQGALTKATSGRGVGAAHLSSVICVSFRIAASAETPLTPMLLPSRLCERGAEREWQMSKRVKGR